jgi:signal transduction histidine kinase
MHSKEDILYRTILIVTVIIGIIILCFVLSVIWQQRKWRKLNAQKVEIEINTLENERKRLAADLHDELGGVLSAMKFKLESIDCATEADQKQVDQCVHLVQNMVAKIRWISNALLPETLAHKGLLSAVIEYANLVNGNPELKIIVENNGIPEIPPTRGVHIFRILQEIIHNTLKHSKAHSLKIQFLTENDKLVVLTADDGKGFDYQSAVQRKKGLGLDSLQNRAEMLGGEFHLSSHAETGTRCHIRIPYN